jgi:hypothetical protein
MRIRIRPKKSFYRNRMPMLKGRGTLICSRKISMRNSLWALTDQRWGFKTLRRKTPALGVTDNG